MGTAPIGDQSEFPQVSMLPDSVLWRVTIPITGASGATATLLDGPNGIAVARSSQGIYAVTGIPPCPSATSAFSKASFWFQTQSPALTIVDIVITTAFDTTAGTLTFKTLNASGSATDPADQDRVVMFCLMEKL